ncbi:hypothetical protein AXE80_06380 [Wenyingzhuangia fucanilytica]|uniref:Uncharacterized protein n=1 Tax=Wenyingzhuangia fucanilytica TaxID=1790137 RepID=A0A1B1Y5B5_9FLAO|nr:hypothetical protein [Wenyingzhuangia fucanilytica]ANW95928.1 hypothetical protein AXE80_06380 [Wenyingzhuangia fucanilytica]
MPREMYTYTLNILEKVSFDVDLFINEFNKATKRLLPHEINELHLWVTNFIFMNPHLEPASLVLNAEV